MAYVYKRSTDRKWMWFFFAVTALLAFGAFMAWGHLAYDARISCDRWSDSCEAVKHKNLGTTVTPFRLSEAKGAYRVINKDSRGRLSAGCARINMTRGAPLSFCNLSDGEFIDSFNTFLKDPAAARFDAEMERALFGYVVAWVAALLGLVPLVLGMALGVRLWRGTAYRSAKRRG
jgi:hypothetical protein